MIQQPRRRPLRVGQVAALVAMAGFGLVDVTRMAGDGALRQVTAPILVSLALATVALWLPRHRQGSRLLPVLAGTLAAVSLEVTGLSLLGLRHEGSWGLAEAAGMLLVLLVVARRGAAPLAVPAALGLLLALAVQPLRSGSTSVLFAAGMLQALCGAAAVTIGGYQRYAAAAGQQQVLVARAEQRAEFARDLHDFVAHHVTGIVVQAQGARYVAEQDPKQVAAALAQIERAGSEAMSAMRRMVAMLRDWSTDAPLAPLAGLDDLKPLVEGFSSAGGPPVHLHVHGALDHLPMDVTTSAYRVVMEALTNVRQHAAGATRVDVQVQRTPDWLLVRVVDDAAPRHRLPVHRDRPGYGLTGLTERVHTVGGWLRAGPAIGRGWAVDAALPLRRPS